MRTNNVGTKSEPAFRSPRDLQLPGDQKASAKQLRASTLGDAELAVIWLNAAKKAKAASSYDMAVSIRGKLEELQALTKTLQQVHGELTKMLRQVHAASGKAKTLLESEMQAQAVKHRRLFDEAKLRTNALNRILSKYVFRPGVTYFVTADAWWFGMMSDVKGFRLKDGDRLISEGDVVMALVRLASTAEIKTVHLCSQCRERWKVAKRNIDRFCSDSCRTIFHTHNDEYRTKKAASQREYRKRLKQQEANQNEDLKGWKKDHATR